jgi:predicted phosphoadenosine phosphosulfate sulfurtransferase
MKKNNIKHKIGVLFVDLESQYELTIDYIKREFENKKEYIDPYWVCLPLNLRNATSVFQPFWTCWSPEQKEKWVREYPAFNVVNENNHKFDFFKKNMEFEEFVPEFGRWYSDGKRTACLVGIRSDESLNRFRTIASNTKEKIDNNNWTTKISENVYNCYPIYDWTVQDVWVGNGKMQWDYNKLYDMFYKAGISLANQRICQPYGDDQRIGINLFRIIEPKTWHKVVNRVSGANFGNIYAGNKIMGYRNVKLPAGHTWKSYCKLLLATLPEDMRNHYKEKFIKFMKYWNKNGCPINEDYYDKIPDEAEILNKISTRGNKDKKLIRYKKIPDKLDNDFESKKMAPTWRRMAVCILKNDHLCKTLSFAQTKNQQERMKALLEKYKNL